MEQYALWYNSITKKFIKCFHHVDALIDDPSYFGLSKDDFQGYDKSPESEEALVKKVYSNKIIRIRKFLIMNKLRYVLYDEQVTAKYLLEMLLENKNIFNKGIICFDGEFEFDFDQAIEYLSTYL